MKSAAVVVVLALFLTTLISVTSALAPLARTPRGEYVKDEYIVVLKKGMTLEARDAHIAGLSGDFTLSQGANQVKTVFQIGDNFVGFHAKLSLDMLARERASPDVQYIEYNHIVKTLDAEESTWPFCRVQRDATWGLDRINEVGIRLDGRYSYRANGYGVDAYIIDTGILTTHQEFNWGRATWGTNTIDDENVDCHGHGTHVAGIVGGTKYGVAKRVNLIAVKCMNCDGYGEWADVIEAIEWVVNQAKATRTARGRRSVVNISIGGEYNQAANDAVEAAVAQDIPFAIGAGNDYADACNFSPASAPSALTVGATTVADTGDSEQQDLRSDFSNFGPCVDIFAPGEDITSAWIDSNDATLTISGTSMATPHVAGAAAILLSANRRFTSDQVAEALGAAATKNVIDLACTNTNSTCSASPNALLYSRCVH